MSQKMQQLLDLIVNEEMDKANELFHEIVVEKSREIYENLIAEEAEEDEEEMDESAEEDEEEDESVEEGFGMEDETEDHLGGDATDDMVGDVSDHDSMGDEEGGEFGSEEGGVPATKDDVQDLEDALAELKAEFEALMGGSAGGEDDGEEEFGDEEDSEDDQEDDEDSEDDEEDFEENMGVVREYRERVGNDWQGNSMKSQGKNIGANTGEGYPAPAEGKSPVSSGSGKPTSGANAKNIAQQNTGEGTNVGTAPNADKGSRGLVGSTKGEFTKGVEKNISNSSKSGMKDGAALDKVAKGHGAEKKGSGPAPVGAGTGDKAGQTSVAPIKPFLKKL